MSRSPPPSRRRDHRGGRSPATGRRRPSPCTSEQYPPAQSVRRGRDGPRHRCAWTAKSGIAAISAFGHRCQTVGAMAVLRCAAGQPLRISVIVEDMLTGPERRTTPFPSRARAPGHDASEVEVVRPQLPAEVGGGDRPEPRRSRRRRLPDTHGRGGMDVSPARRARSRYNRDDAVGKAPLAVIGRRVGA